MLRVFNQEITQPGNFVVTLELVPGRESIGRSIDTITGIARDAFSDGRVSAVSITDNPGGNPSLSPDVLGYEIFKTGLDVIVHFTCRDMNRAGMESRALQLARMGMKTILALTGDYSGRGFGGQGAPVFDFDSVILTAMLRHLSERLLASGDPDGFFTGCAVSPFKTTRAECRAQYAKLGLKLEAGASFVITQLGYDVHKYQELMAHRQETGIQAPVLGSVYLLSPRAARAMNRGRVPGAHVPDSLYQSVVREWQQPREGLKLSIDRTAKLGVILKGFGYSGIHIGGVHRSFKTVGAILDRMDALNRPWQEYLDEFGPRDTACFYLYPASGEKAQPELPEPGPGLRETLTDHCPYRVLKTAHDLMFNKASPAAPLFRQVAKAMDTRAWILKLLLEDPVKQLFLSCRSCGDCAIQHVAFQCPESGCPKHTRNGACGGSSNGYCEVNIDRLCIWVRAFRRLQRCGEEGSLCKEYVPPRLWELNRTSSWINFHLGRDHQR
ncbi:MAG: methylenetetrahydrofolate reductase C-terminal domain-containing protein [Pseudomonadota bacterium]